MREAVSALRAPEARAHIRVNPFLRALGRAAPAQALLPGRRGILRLKKKEEEENRQLTSNPDGERMKLCDILPFGGAYILRTGRN